MSDDIASLVIEVKSDGVDKAKRSLADLSAQGQKAEQSVGNLGKGAKNAESSIAGMAGSVKNLIGAYAGLSTVIGFTKIADEYTKFNAQLKIATGTQKEFAQALKDVNAIAVSTQSSISSISTLYARLNTSLKDIGVSQEKVARIAENVGLSLKVAGASAAESSSAMMQLSQAFGSGVLRGEEFNALMESAPNLMRALADSIGVPIGQLRQLASDGQITADVLTKAFSDEGLLEKLRGQAKEVETISGNLELLKNTVINIAGTFSEKTGLVDLFTTAIRDLNDALRVTAGLSELDFKLAKFLPDYQKFISKQDAEGLPVNIGGKNGSILPRGAKITDELPRIDIGQIGQVDAAYEKLRKSYQSFAKDNPLKDAVAKQREYTENLKKINEYESVGLISIQEADRYRSQLNLELEKTTKQTKILAEVKDTADKEEIRRLNVAFWLEEQIYLQKKKEAEETEKIAKIEQESIKRQLAIRQEIANRNFEEAQQEAKKLDAEMLRQFEKTVDGINEEFRRGFANMVNGGKTTWKSFTKSLVTTFKTTVADAIYKMFAEPFVVKIVASVVGVGVSGAANAAGSIAGASSGSGSIFGMISDGIGSLNTNIVGSLESFGAYIADGMGGISDSIGGFIGANSEAIADGFSYAGALFQAAQGNYTGAIGTAIGTYYGGPVGGAIGSLIGGAVGSLFGGGHVSRPKYYANTAVTNTGSNLINAYGNSDASGTGGDVAINAGKGLADAILAYTKAFGGSASDFTIGTNYQSKYNTYWASIGSSIQKSGSNADFLFTPEKAADATAQAFFVAVEKGLVTIPDYLKNVIVRSSINLDNALDSANALGTVYNLKKALTDLPPVFNSIAQVIDNTLTLDKVDELQTRFNAINTYTSLFYTDAEKFGYFTKQVTTQFNELNLALPDSRDAFRALVEGVDTTTASGLSLFNSLIDLAPTMDAYYKALQQQDEAVKALTASMELLDIDAFANVIDFNRYKGLANNYGNDFANRVNSGELVTYGNSNNTTVSLGTITPTNNTTISTSDPNLLEAMRVLTAKVEALQLAADKSAIHSKRAADVLVNVSPNGNAIQTEAVA